MWAWLFGSGGVGAIGVVCFCVVRYADRRWRHDIAVRALGDGKLPPRKDAAEIIRALYETRWHWLFKGGGPPWISS
jgi:hypothetical protein